MTGASCLIAMILVGESALAAFSSIAAVNRIDFMVTTRFVSWERKMRDRERFDLELIFAIGSFG